MTTTLESWQSYANTLHRILCTTQITDAGGAALDQDAGLATWATLTCELRKSRGTVFLIGNGASASMASHLAADLAKNAQVHSEVFTDLSLITAISNDIGYDQVFAEPLSRRGRPGDMLVAISSSGGSPNILRAMETAARLGMTTVTLSGMKADNPLRSMGTLNLYVAGVTYGEVESCHAAMLHFWMDRVALPGAGTRPASS